jgi:phosphate acyltransferase
MADDLPKDIELVFFGCEDFTDGTFPCKVTFVETKESFDPDENLISAIRTKKDTSMTRAVQMLADGKIDAMISIGNTGALVGSARLYLDRIDGIKKPALLATLPTKKHPLAVIDVGGNVNTKAEHLIQFAQMGIAYQHCRGIEKPRMALLNIGHEEAKGYDELILAFKKLQKFPGFHGNIEARNVFDGEINVLITDGFAGNILLKTAEGMADFVCSSMDSLPKNVNYAEHPGAILCGVNGIVVKCHGYSSGLAILSGIRGTVELIREKFIEKLKKELT